MKSKILLGATILFGLMMVNSGLNKFLNYMSTPEMSQDAQALMGAFYASGWMLPLIGIVEIIGGVLIAIPKYRALGAIIILPVVVGIALFHVVLEPSALAISLVLLAITIWAIIDNKEKYLPLIK